MTRNPRSGKVMQKIGMKYEGHLRQAWNRWDKFEDVEMYAVLRSDFIH
jgi:RimJ/RimL family protein N-acetyltransferase